MTETIAALLGETHRSVPLPFSNACLEAAVTSLVTGEDRELLEPLMEGLHGNRIVEDNRALAVFGVQPTAFVEAARRALTAMPDFAAA
jgi:hypothetical protein